MEAFKNQIINPFIKILFAGSLLLFGTSCASWPGTLLAYFSAAGGGEEGMNAGLFAMLGMGGGGGGGGGTNPTVPPEETQPTISIADPADVSEGNAGTQTVVFTVSLSSSYSQTVSVDYVTDDANTLGETDPANAGTDYTAIASATLDFLPGETSKTIDLTVNGDPGEEPNETAAILFSNPVNASLASNSAKVVILNDDTTPDISFNIASSSGAEDAGASLQVDLTPAPTSAITLNYTVTAGTATVADDYSDPGSGSITIPAGSSSYSLPINIVDDTKTEADETFTVALAAGSGYNTTGTTSHVYTITNNDADPSISINDATVTEGDGVTATFTVSLSHASYQNITVTYATTNSTAISTKDYTAKGGTLTFLPGETSKDIEVTILNDTKNEASETFFMNLSLPGNATISDNKGLATINDDGDAAPAISIADKSVNEGNSGITAHTFTVTLNKASGQTVTVNYATAANSPLSAEAVATCPGTPVANSDYETKSGTLTFPEDTISRTITVNVCGDAIDEGGNQTYLVNLSSPTNASVSDGTALGTIIDDENSVVQFNVLSSSVTEGTATVTVQLDVNTTAHGGLTVALGFGNDTDGGTDDASAPLDYTTISNISIADGLSSKTFDVTIADDSIDEHAEVFVIGIGSGAYVIGGNSTHTVTIYDNDVPKVDFTAATGTASSNAEDTAGTRTLDFEISPLPVDPLTITYSYGGSATAGTDFDNTVTSVAVAAGASSGSISLPITADSMVESDESVVVTITTGTGYEAGVTRPAHTFTITNDDSVGYVISNFNYPSIPENGTISSGYTVKLNSQPNGDVVLNFSTSDPASGSINITSHTFNSTNWNSAVTVSITGVPENIDDGDVVVTSSVTFGSTTDTTGYSGTGLPVNKTVTVNDDDTAGFSIPSTSVSMTEGGTGAFSVKLTSEPTGDVVINVTPPGDATVDKSTLTFTTGNWNSYQTVTVTAIDDLYEEISPEIVSVVLAVNAGSTADAKYDPLDPSDITVNITDNDTAGYTVTPTTINAVEAGAGVSFTVRPTSNPEGAHVITINLAATAEYSINTVESGTKTAGQNAVLTFSYSGDPATLPAAKTVTVYALDDSVSNSGKSRTITLDDDTSTTATGYGATLANPTVTANITESGSPGVTVSAATVSATEGGATASFTVVLDKLPNGNVGISLASADSSQISIDKASLLFTTGDWSNTQTITVTAVDDALLDGNVDVNIAITINAGTTTDTSGYLVLNPADVTATAVDNDVAVTISSAETLDADCNGRIDHYRITFSGNVSDSTFPGYIANATGTSTADWIVSGYSNVKLVHGTQVASDFGSYCGSAVADTANDNVLFLKFTEGAGYDGGAKPDLTTTASPALESSSGTVMAQVFTASVTESDKVKPIITNAYADALSTALTVVFSEAVYGNSGAKVACTSGASGNIGAASVTYVDGAGTTGASSVSSIGSDACASDTGLNAVFTMNTAFASDDGDGVPADDTVSASAGLYDAADNTGTGTAAFNVAVTAGPRINSATIYDSNNNGKIDQIKLVFNKNMKDISIWNKTAQFVYGGTALVTVDSVTYSAGGTGGGTITTPNDDSGTSNDTIVTLFTNDAAVAGTDVKALSFTTAVNTWEDSVGIDLQSIADLSSLTVDKAPPVILTAVAYDNTNSIAGVDDDDTLVITFSEPTSKPSITAANINSIFTLTGGHVWGSIQSATWNASGDQLTILFGSGADVAVSDTITILNTIQDNAAVPNEAISIAAVQSISGSFFTDTVKPYMLTVSNITPTSVTIKFSESMLADGTANAINTIANFRLDEKTPGTCATTTDSNIPIASATAIAPDTVELALGGSETLCDVDYTISIASGRTVVDFPGGNTIGVPDSLTFLGNERIKVLSATAIDTYTVRLMFSKVPLSGTDVAGSAGCSTAVECAKRYKITPSLGDITSATIGTGALANTVVLTHTLQQSGSAYTVIAANNADGDNFDNTAWGAIKSFDGVQDLKPYPDDRASFIGKGVVLDSFEDGAFYSDPFADGTTFAWAFTYGGMIYLGTNDHNNAAFRFEPDGANAVTTTFDFVTAGATCSTAVGFGTAANDCGTGTQGPNGEYGVGGFTSVTFTIGGIDYEALFVGPIKSGIGKAYFTQDVDTKLDWKEFPIYNTVGNNSESIHTIYGFENHLIICLSTNHNSAAPICGHHTVSVSGGVLSIGADTDMRAGKVSGIGKADGNNANIAGIDSMIYFNNHLYFGNNGGVKYADSATSNSFSEFAANSGTDYVVDTTPSASAWSNNGVNIYTKALPSLGKIRPGEKGIAKFLEFNGRLYMARNVTTTVNSTVIDHGELWVCVPGGDNICDSADWSRLISGKETQLPSVNSISMLQDNGSGVLYVGFDDNTTVSPTG
ncbi:MAG: hypothetical protein OEZ34_00900, partial [Spirochaetia bacterium]|nr:hypothetical protein [Spirochaetia bacterium]